VSVVIARFLSRLRFGCFDTLRAQSPGECYSRRYGPFGSSMLPKRNVIRFRFDKTRLVSVALRARFDFKSAETAKTPEKLRLS